MTASSLIRLGSVVNKKSSDFALTICKILKVNKWSSTAMDDLEFHPIIPGHMQFKLKVELNGLKLEKYKYKINLEDMVMKFVNESQFVGLLSLFDPPIHDSAETILIECNMEFKDIEVPKFQDSAIYELICAVAPSLSNTEETHNILKFAHCAKHIENRAKENKIIDEKSMIKKYQNEIWLLKEEPEPEVAGSYNFSSGVKMILLYVLYGTCNVGNCWRATGDTEDS
ncbi:kinesin-like protein KIN-7K, chloroplastic [Artemisia annua]|uniref:Kinesin-like protein KIN-7K, chloroplastic n=1 Tax=Artemisia annua TaxID=35608 RepID=A0A2U1PNC1_ARTAN|nr:kinesin-like protein KIN-7K, chloroplastic [Artemisia annua]